MSTGPTISDPASMVGQFYDAETISLASTDWVPTVSGKSFARALFVGTGIATNTLKVDLLGIGGSGGQTGVTLTGVLGGTVLALAVTKVYKTGTTVSTITALY